MLPEVPFHNSPIRLNIHEMSENIWKIVSGKIFYVEVLQVAVLQVYLKWGL